MATRKNKILLGLVLAVFVISFSSILLSDESKYCTTSYLAKSSNEILDIFCSRQVGEGVLLPVWLFSGITALISFLLLFLKEQVFNTWKKFAIVFIAISAIWITLAPANCGGGWAGFGGCVFSKEITAWFTSGLFLVSSLLLIIIKSVLLRKHTKLESTPDQPTS